MTIIYTLNPVISVTEFIALLNDSGLGLRRPVDDINCIELMLQNANLTIVAKDGNKIVGVVRSITDFSFACYLSDLAVARDYQRQGIGKALLTETKKMLGKKCTMILLSAPQATEYYPKLGFDKHPSAWVMSPGKEVVI